MLDTTSESLLSLAEAAEGLPRRRRGRKTHVSTLYRWTVAGCRGIILESIQIGATRATSWEALQRFFDRLTSPSEGGGSASQPSSSRLRQLRHDAATSELARL